MVKLVEGTKILNKGGQALILSIPGDNTRVIKLFKDLDNFRREQRMYDIISRFDDVVQVSQATEKSFEWRVEDTKIPSSIDSTTFYEAFQTGKVYGGLYLKRLNGIDFEHYSRYFWNLDEDGSAKETLAMFKNFYEALKELHTIDISHNDVKPENAIITTNSDGKKIVVFDFGNSTQLSDLETKAVPTTFEFTPWFCYPFFADKQKMSTNYLRDFYSLFFVFTYLANVKSPDRGLPWLSTIQAKVNNLSSSYTATEAKAKLFWEYENEYIENVQQFAVKNDEQNEMAKAQMEYIEKVKKNGLTGSIVSGFKWLTGTGSDFDKLNDTLKKFVTVLEERFESQKNSIGVDMEDHQKKTFEELDNVFL
jgi:serine/threonine protein kinase